MPATRSWLIGALLLFWNVLGFDFNWSKAHRGVSVPWIGAQITIRKADEKWGMLTTLQGKKLKEMQQLVLALHRAKGMVDVKMVQTMAGQLSWAAGLFPWARSFNSMVWAALTAHSNEQATQKYSKKKRPTQLFFIQRIDKAIHYVKLLLAGLFKTPLGTLTLQKWTSTAARSSTSRWCIRSDASPFGFGAILFWAGVPQAWIAGTWEKDDLDRFKAEMGDPAWQAEWEIYATLLAIDVWLKFLWGHPLAMLQLDATAALHSILRASGRTPAMNAIAAEIALRLEIGKIELQAEHLTGTLNFDCDALSRLAMEGKKVPQKLVSVRRDVVPHRGPSFFWGWPESSASSSSST